jgi:plastocyanin
MDNERSLSRRNVLRASGGVAAAVLLAGCSADSDDGTEDGGDDSTVTVGPDGSLAFEPNEITISTGETVTWEFDSASHNVVGWPDMHETVSIPEGAEGFGTMEQGGNIVETVGEGETFEHTFETAGEYTYVCGPHATNMVGTVVVEE